MKIAILGTRGIPNNHGGFEQFAEYLTQYLVNNEHEVYVYNSHSHPNQEKKWKEVNIVHCYDPEDKIGAVGQFIYDFNCILDSRKRGFDVILQLGYTSSSIWSWLLPTNSKIITNMDGLEWKRSKYTKPVQKFLKYAEKLAVRSSDFLIADSIGIKEYLYKKYSKESEYIAYGANLFNDFSEGILAEYDVTSNQYNILIARLEPENNIEMILDGVVSSTCDKKMLVIGKHQTKFGEYLKEKYDNNPKIRFLGGIYNQNHLNNLRYYSNLYFHGHSVGGTNPSLLEAMSSNAFIIANNNIFNKSILGDDAFYFSTELDVSKLMLVNKREHKDFLKNNKEKIVNKYHWDLINNQYEKYLLKCLYHK